MLIYQFSLIKESTASKLEKRMQPDAKHLSNDLPHAATPFRNGKGGA